MSRPAVACAALGLALALAGCKGRKPAGGDAAVATEVVDIDSHDVLGRGVALPEVVIEHVRIGWKELAPPPGGALDVRAARRSRADAARLAQEVAARLRADLDSIDAVVQQHSEDPAALSGETYTVTAGSAFAPELERLALRLRLREVGIVATALGYEVVARVPPPPPDPLASTDILARPAGADWRYIQHVLAGWKDVPAARQGAVDPRAAARTKAAADQLAQEILAKVRAGADMAALMKQYSEDPGSKDNAFVYRVSAKEELVEPVKRLALRLELGEAGMITSVFGWHVIKRVSAPAAPPADRLESADILARAPVATACKVKHILLGWNELNTGDPRAKGRERATLEALVTQTVAALARGAKIEPLMKALSEDPGSAASGAAYEVSPDVGGVPAFRNLALRLQVGEVGVVKTRFGIHILQRVE